MMLSRCRDRSRLAALILCAILSFAGADAVGATGKEGRTPFGSDAAGNDAGTIPPWTGGLTQPPPSWDGKTHPDPFGDDPVLEVIDGSTRPRDDLAPGVRALLDAYPQTFSLRVHRSRRSHALPETVLEATRAGTGQARLVEGGVGFAGVHGAIPFPAADQALEVYWNHVARWRGRFLEGRALDANVYANGRFVLTTREIELVFPYYGADADDERLYALLARVTAPARSAGSAALVIEPLSYAEGKRRAWTWDAGRRRVVRAPQLAFDQPVNTADGLHTADDVDLINGSPERFSWTLLGKRELLVPYNCYALEAAPADESLLWAGHLNPAWVRWERHRVWVLEGRLKGDWRHAYSRRVLYLDEDSWMALMAENYDARGDLWRVNFAYPMNYYELPGTLPVAFAYHDLPARRYHVKGLRSAEVGGLRTTGEAPPDGRFTPQGLRRYAR